VVSEERGTVTAARDGRLEGLPGPEALAEALRSHLDAIAPAPDPRTRWQSLASRWPEALAAIAIAAALWIVRVPGSDVIEMRVLAPLRVENLPAGFELEGIEPPEVEVTLSGTRWDLFRSRAQPISVRIDAVMVGFGRRTFRLSPGQVEHPPDVEAQEIAPSTVRLLVKETAPRAAAP
jgi:hypothetical protein